LGGHPETYTPVERVSYNSNNRNSQRDSAVANRYRRRTRFGYGYTFV